METRGRVKNWFILAIFIFLLRAYLEPGSSSFLLKIIISGLVGIVVFFRQIRIGITSFYRRRITKTLPATTDSTEEKVEK